MATSSNRLHPWVQALLLVVAAGGVGRMAVSFSVGYLPGNWASHFIFLSVIAVFLGLRAKRATTPRKRAGLVVALLASFYLWGCTLLAIAGWDVMLTRTPSTDVVDWEQRESRRMTNLDRYNRDELEFLRPLLDDRRVVLLGESSHGVEQYSQVKANIIRYLHEELGFNVIAFESYMLSSNLANEALSDGARPETAIDCLYPMWDTPTVQRLFRYIAGTKTTVAPLELAGFDPKLHWNSWPKAMAVLSAAIESDTALVRSYMNAQQRFGPDIYDRIRSGKIRGNSPLGKEFATFYTDLADGIEQLRIARVDTTESRRRDFLFAAQLARSIAALPHFHGARNPFTRVAVRDSVMAENLVYLIERQYAGEKVIVWAHNEHISRSWSDTELSDVHSQVLTWATSRLDHVKRMGEYLGDRYGEDEYAVGLYMASGSYETIRGWSRRVRPPRRDSVEYLLRDPQAAAVYLDLTGTTDDAGHDWEHAPSSVQTDSYWYSIIPADQFDGLILVTRATPPGS